jgi:hypothetical protein
VATFDGDSPAEVDVVGQRLCREAVKSPGSGDLIDADPC